MGKDSEEIKEKFTNAANEIKANTELKLDNDTLLSLYGYYKQGLEGDCNTEAPGFLDFKGKAKWEAWNKLKGLSNEDAMKKYYKKVKKILEVKK
jgi:diazepam-binding inhibitor (GABA receptor modulating acyl-CoA-binding protein)